MKRRRSPRNTALWIVLLLTPLLWELFVGGLHAAHVGWDVFGFHAWFGFGACALLVVVALLVGRGLKRDDKYYDNE